MADVLTAAASELANAIRSSLEELCRDWDQLVGGETEPPSDIDLWDDLPAVDSKAVASTSPIFEKYLGLPLDVKLIRRGGYASIDDVLTDLVPKMEQLAHGQGVATAKDHSNE